jgi:hypothetical protein
MKEKKLTVREFITNQKEYCNENDTPFFMPDTDRCWRCGGQFITQLIKDGETGRDKLITGCPLCNYSFVS